MKKCCVLFVAVFLLGSFPCKSSAILLPMDKAQQNHLKSYGLAFHILQRGGYVDWLLNYRGEPHWPVKWENKKDFQLRMSQFFDHYLKGASMPRWMEKGISALQRGIDSGY